MTKSIPDISVIGLGKLGLPLVAAIASKGYRVIGYDKDSSKIDSFKKDSFPFEPNLESYLTENKDLIQFSSSLSDIAASQLSFVIVPTPSVEDGSFSIEYLKAAFKSLGPVLRQKESFHVISVVSTVLPGDMDILTKVLEESSGKKCGVDFGLCYNPVFIALGTVIYNFLHPDFILIGESDEKSGDILESFYSSFCAERSNVHRMNFVNAELAKISVNTFVTMKISFGNTLARLCEKLPNADADVVAKAIGDDTRIGRKYLKGALGYGGPCFPRDNRAFAHVGKRVGVKARSAEATDTINQEQITWLSEFVKSKTSGISSVAVLGLSYKSETDVIEESQGVGLAKVLSETDNRVLVYDPAAMETSKVVLGDKVEYVEKLNDCLAQADIVVITTAWKEFSSIRAEHLQADSGKRKVIIDCWRVIEDKQFPDNVTYIQLGMNKGQTKFNYEEVKV